MHYEKGERRDFLPDFVARLHMRGAQVLLEHGYGEGMGYSAQDYLLAGNGVAFGSLEEVFQQDYVLVVRCPLEEHIHLMRPGACLVSMLHFPTRPERVELLRSLNLEAISLDSIKDDTGRRLVENLRSVAWNGVEAAFQALEGVYPSPGFHSPERPPIHVTLLGAGAVGIQVVQAAARYGNPALLRSLAAAGVPGVLVTTVEYDTTRFEDVMAPILRSTDILVDATQRPDPTRPVIPNDWIAWLPAHAVLLDLSVDPYDCRMDPHFTKGIEGIPQGNLDQYQFAADDPVYHSLPGCVRAVHRRTVVSCYSWPGIHPNSCMEVYGKQLSPLLRTLIDRGGAQNIQPNGKYFERALARAQLSRWEVSESE
jgi:alanine dehydrogenase